MPICPECGGGVVDDSLDGDYLLASCLDCGAKLSYYLDDPEIIEAGKQ